MSTPFLGEINMFGGNFAPRGWAFCDGRLLAIAENDALFALIGTTYGGDGQTTFALPDLRGRTPVHQGQGPGLSLRSGGEVGGTESVTLTPPQIPSHTHTLRASDSPASAASPVGQVLARSAQSNAYHAGGAQTQLAGTSGATGGNQPHDNMAPFLCVNFIIALEGIFPARN